MSSSNIKSLLILISTLCISLCGGTTSSTNHRKLLENLNTNTHDSTVTPVTNPANFPPYTPTPTIITVPASNPTPLNPINPTPTTTIPASNPITANPTPTTTTPAMNPPTQTPASSGQSWCVAQNGASETALQSALDYACGIGGADCSTIQQGASCYNPNTLQNHASYAFNSYFQKNPVSTSCDFGGAAMVVNTNPSSGSCVYPSSATAGVGAGGGTGTGTATPLSTFPPATTSSTNGATGGSPFGGVDGSPYQVPASGNYGSPPSFLNSSYPASGFPTSYGPNSPPLGNTYPAGSTSMQPCISFIILVASLSIAILVFNSQ